MINDDDSVELADYCFDVCEALNAAIQEKATDGLGGSAQLGLEDLTRYRDCPRALAPVRTPLKSRLEDHPRDRAGAQDEGKHAMD